MYYISRRIGMNKYGVVDTEDGHEDVMTVDDIEYATCEMSVRIEGVTLRSRRSGPTTYAVVDSIDVYTPQGSRQAKEVKLNFLRGVDIKTSNGVIVEITWSKPKDDTNRVIRLSDYGTSCAVGVLVKEARAFYRINKEQQFVTIVLDDKIAIERKTFKKCAGSGAVFDLREVKNLNTVEWFYTEMIADKPSVKHLRKVVIDDPNRLDLWIGSLILNTGDCNLTGTVANPMAVNSWVTARFFNDFTHFPEKFNYTLEPDEKPFEYRANVYGEYVRFLIQYKSLAYCEEYGTCYRQWRMTSETRMRQIVVNHMKGARSVTLTRLENYLKFFNPPKEVRDAFVRFYNRVNQELIAWGRKNGLEV